MSIIMFKYHMEVFKYHMVCHVEGVLYGEYKEIIKCEDPHLDWGAFCAYHPDVIQPRRLLECYVLKA